MEPLVSQQSKMSILELPNEVLFSVFSLLDTKTLAVSIPLVCKLWNELSKSDYLQISLSFSSCSNVLQIPKAIKKYPSLRKLSIEKGIINSSIIQSITLLSCLERISLIQCYIFASSSYSFKNLLNSSSLCSLTMMDCFVDDQIFQVISEAKNLKFLRITQIESKYLINLLENCKLSNLQIDNIDHICEDALMQIFRQCKTSLQSLNLNGRKRLSDYSFENIDQCINLVSLSVCRCDNLSDNVLVKLSYLPSLEVLSLKYAASFSSSGILEFFSHVNASTLFYVDFTMCSNFTDECLMSLVKRCKNLQKLILQNCNKLTDAGILYSYNFFSKLQALDISWNDNLKGAFLEKLRELKHLQVLDIRSCKKIDKLEIRKLRSVCPLLKIFS